VNEQTHKPSHVPDSCKGGCQSVKVDLAEVDRIIQQKESGGIPRLKLPINGELPSELSVAGNGKFIAVSHVWAHGLGNSDNTMPVCQLARLRNFLKEVQGHAVLALVWMDTFCVPTGEQYASSRRKAMSRIAETFRNAEKVLVLDAKLLQTTCKVSPIELCIRVLASDWMRRLWTLEEAMLGCGNPEEDKLIFRLRDGQVTLGQLLKDLRSQKCPYARSAMVALQNHLTLRVVPNFRAWYPTVDSVASKFNQLAKAIEYRNTSREGDEMLCMASILEYPSGEILTASTTEQKAIKFYMTLKHFPISILFCNGLRIPTSPFRWAISSFLTSDNSRKMHPLSRTTSQLVRCEPDGLHIQSMGILFNLELFNDRTFNRVWIQHGKYILEPSAWELLCQPPPWQSWGRLQASTQSDQLVLIINPSSSCEGVVLRKTREESQIYHMEFLCQVYIGRHREKKLVDVGPIRKEETTGYYRFHVDENQDKKSSVTRNNRITTRQRVRGTGEFSRKLSEGQQRDNSELPEPFRKEDRKRVYAVRARRTMADQKWVIH